MSLLVSALSRCVRALPGPAPRLVRGAGRAGRIVLGPIAPAVRPLDVRGVVRISEGRVIEHRGRQVAVYRDASGETSAFDARCPHRGCAVEFNARERRWDCPCHLATFSLDGSVLDGRGLVSEPLRRIETRS